MPRICFKGATSRLESAAASLLMAVLQRHGVTRCAGQLSSTMRRHSFSSHVQSHQKPVQLCEKQLHFELYRWTLSFAMGDAAMIDSTGSEQGCLVTDDYSVPPRWSFSEPQLTVMSSSCFK